MPTKFYPDKNLLLFVLLAALNYYRTGPVAATLPLNTCYASSRNPLTIRSFIVILTVLIPAMTSAQDKIVPSEDRSRFSFAQTYIGLSTQYLAPATLNHTGQTVATFPAFLQPRFLIGGPHFWGLIDFYISIPVSSPIKLGPEQDLDNSFLSTGTITGLKVYPGFRRTGQVSPYVGVNWSFLRAELDLEQTKGPRISKQRIALEGGLTYTDNRWNVLELNVMYTPANTLNYYSDRITKDSIEWPGLSFSISYKRMFDITKNTQPIRNLENRPHLNTWHVGIGPSSAQSLERAEFLNENTPFMNNPISWQIFPEISAGYYLHKPDLDFRFTYRPMRHSASAHDVSQKAYRHSLAFEVYKKLFDYHGFVPFIGPTLAQDWYHFRQSGDNIDQVNVKESAVVAGIVFGWDIRPTQYNSWLLRTNLRFYPTAGISVNGYEFSMNQLEVNFIQLVIFPNRFF